MTIDLGEAIGIKNCSAENNDDEGFFTHKERHHLAALQKRLDHLRGGDPNRKGDPAYPPGEANALAWVMAVTRENEALVRTERLERSFKKLAARLGKLEREWAEGDDED
jgi:hypothetical protein